MSPTQSELVELETRPLVLSNSQLLLITRILEKELDQGLHGSSTDSLKLYPTFVFDLPNGSERGKFLALDLGGTNFRVLLIYLEGNHQSYVVNQTYAISQQLMQGSGPQLFDYIAHCLYNFMISQRVEKEKLSLGFTFSFPCKQIGLKRAYLTSWTKGFSCSDTVNKDVCEMLQTSLMKYPDIDVEVAAIVNDTTGTLTSCAYSDPDCKIGIIIGMVMAAAARFAHFGSFPRHRHQRLLPRVGPISVQRSPNGDQHRVGRLWLRKSMPRLCSHRVGLPTRSALDQCRSAALREDDLGNVPGRSGASHLR